MELELLRQYLLAKKGTTEERPFGPEALVFKVVGKMYGLVAWQATPLQISLKCDPELALTLRERYSAIIPGYHLNKAHWNTITLDGSVPEAEIFSLIDHSYDLVIKKLKRADRQKLLDAQ
jgi:predicted DNA-binding protein (MmcQ/YjbR family)